MQHSAGALRHQGDFSLHRRIHELEELLVAAQHAVHISTHTETPAAHALLPAAPSATEAAAVDAAEGKGWFDSIDDIPPGATVWVTFVNGDEKYREMMLNWAYHLRAIDVPHIVVAFDDVAAAVCAENGIPHLRCALRAGEVGVTSAFWSAHTRMFACVCVLNA